MAGYDTLETLRRERRNVGEALTGGEGPQRLGKARRVNGAATVQFVTIGQTARVKLPFSWRKSKDPSGSRSAT